MSVCLSACLSVCKEQLVFHWTDFQITWYLSNFWNSVEKIQFSLKSDKDNCYFHEDQYTFMIITRHIILRMKNISVINFRENQNPYFVFNIFFNESCVVDEIMWKNNIEPDRPYMTIWRMRIECCIPKSTNTHSEYVILVSFHYKNGCFNVPQRYVILALFVLLRIRINLGNKDFFHSFLHTLIP